MAGKKVTDPALLEKLNGGSASKSTGRKVTDPSLLAKLNGGEQPRASQSAVPALDTLNAAANGFVNGIPIVGPTLSNFGHNVDAGFNNMLAAIPGNPLGIAPETADQRAAEDAKLAEDHPIANAAGQFAGAVVPLAAAGSTALGARALGMTGSLGQQMLMGGLSSGAIAGADTAARGGDLQDVANSALAGSALGGSIPLVAKAGGAVLKGFRKPASEGPSLDALQAEKNAAYKAVDKSGARYSPAGFEKLAGDMMDAATADNISPTRHPAAYSMLQDIIGRVGNSKSLTELDQLRQEIRRDLLSKPDAAERHFGQLMIKKLDGFIDDADPRFMESGDGRNAADLITSARKLNTRYRKTEAIDTALDNADLQTAATGSGGNINNVIRQKFAAILKDPRKRAGFSDDELKDMEAVVRGTKGGNILRLVGKLSPSGNGLMAALGLGATMVNPASAAAPALGLAAKTLADRGTGRAAAALRGRIATGQPVKTRSLGEWLKNPGDARLAPAAVPLALGAGNQLAMPPVSTSARAQ